MRGKMQNLDQVSRLLDGVLQLPLGHPDRLRLLIHAEEIMAVGEPSGERALQKPRPVVQT